MVMSSDVQQLAMSERSRKLTEQWLFEVADLHRRSRFISNGLPGDAQDVKEPMQTARMKEVVNAKSVDGDEVGRPRGLAAGKGSTSFSSSRSWRSCNEEVIKKVIRESLLLNSSDGDRAASSRSLGSYLRGRFDLLSNCEGEMKRDDSVTASDRPVKMKTPSLIARLMGLEEVPVGAAESPKRSSDQNPNAKAATLMLHFRRPERVTLRSIIEREKIERDLFVNEHVPSVAEAMQEQTSWGRGEEKEDFHTCKCSAHEAADSAKLKLEEVITVSDRRKSEHELETKEVGILRKTELEPSKNSKTPSSVRHEQRQNEASKALKKFEGSRRPVFSRDRLRSRKDDVKDSAASSSPSKKNADAAKRNIFNKLERKLAYRNSTTPAVEKKDTGAKPAQKITKSKTAKQKDGEEISPSCKSKDAPVIDTSPSAEPSQQKQLSSKSSIDGQSKKDPKMIYEIMPKAANRAAAASAELAENDLIGTKRADKVECLESLLLGCQSVLLALGDAADADTCTHRETRDTSKIDMDVKPYLSCAEELILRKRHHQQLLSHPLLLKRCSWESAGNAPPLDQLVGEVCKGIRSLANYGEVDHEVSSSRDSLYARLKRDLECKDTALDAAWDVGWRNAVCVEEADRVAGQLAEHVLSALVEEFAMELVNCCCCRHQKGFSQA